MRTSFEAIFTLFFIGLIIGLPTYTDAQQGEEHWTFLGSGHTCGKMNPNAFFYRNPDVKVYSHVMFVSLHQCQSRF